VFPALLLAPNDCMILFNKVDKPPTSEPHSAIWHFGWHVPDVRATLEAFKSRPDLDPWVAKLRGEDVRFLEETYRLDETRAAMIEGPSKEAPELVEVR
jgi:hypothetical protein